jgi:predicted dehydrogenase
MIWRVAAPHRKTRAQIPPSKEPKYLTEKGARMKTKPNKVRYTVVGLGHLAQVAVLPAFKQARNSELAALISSEPNKLTKLSEQYKVSKTYSYDQYEECLRSGIDAVYIVLPNHLHREFTVRALKAGIHVLCEKPMAPTTKDCQAMIDSARKHNCKLMIAYRLHFEKANLEAIDIVRRGKLGEPRFFSSDFAQQVVKDNVRVTEPVSKGGGPIYDMGIYCINAARYLFAAEPTEVSATSATIRESRFRNTEEMTAVTMRFPGERLATFTASFGAADIGRYTVIGTKGTLTADPGYEYAEGINLETKVSGRSKKQTFAKRDQFAGELVYFSDCILRNKKPEPSGEEGLADVRIIEAIYKSARNGKVVKLARSTKKDRPQLDQEIRRPAHEKPATVEVESPSGEAA